MFNDYQICDEKSPNNRNKYRLKIYTNMRMTRSLSTEPNTREHKKEYKLHSPEHSIIKNVIAKLLYCLYRLEQYG